MILVDTHAHLDQEEFDADRAEVVARAVSAGVRALVTVAVGLDSCHASIRLAGEFAPVFAAVGVHPNYTHEARHGDWDQVRQLALSRAPEQKIVALGETGLDRFRDYAPFELQQDYFDRHLRLSQETGLPFIVHARDSLDDILPMLREARSRGTLTGIMHSYTGDLETALACVELGLHISFAGMLTFKKSAELREVAAGVPLERLLVETDSPYLSPEPLRGKRNEPANVAHTARKLAEARAMDVEELSRQASENARRLFGLPADLF